MRQIFTIATLIALVPMACAITPEQTEFFEKKVRPVLAEQCYKCHGPEKQKADLRVDSRAAILKGSDVGPVVVPGDPKESTIIKSLRHQGDSKMPEKADKLPEEQIAAIEEWVKMGMPWPENDKPATGGFSADATKSHWSWQPLREPAVPNSKLQTPVDAFVAAKLEEMGWSMSPRASKRTLIRRATFDLTGLPATAEEIAAFENDNSADAWAKLIDRLLASPRYGERWGRHWLDVARYADTKGYVFQEERRYTHSYTYRDWVVRAFNDDMPYDQFVVQQIAGDHVTKPGDNTPMAALGFLTLGRRFINNQHDIIDDRIDVVTRGLMGITVSCARCHDHKFDPISTKDYYALYGVFASSTEPASKDLPPLPATNRDPKEEAEFRRQLAEREGKIDAFFEEKRDLLAWRTLLSFGVPTVLPAEKGDRRSRWLDRSGNDALTNLRNKVEELNSGPLAPPRAMALVDKPEPVKPRILIRGNPGRPGEEVPRRFLTVLSGGEPKPFVKGSGRLELAQAIASKDNPLTARVMVNRVWTHHFGKGLVRTPGDFGVKGEPPTHPELLDWLASRFMAEGWSVKKLHRTIMLSATYQQVSDDRPDLSQADPDNRLVWRMNRRRLDFEAMRDSLLACSGELDLTMGGRGVELTTAPFAKRRAVHGFIDRQNLPGVFRTFDFASPDSSNPQRFVTTVPQQALFMMNNPFVVERARRLVSTPEFKPDAAYEDQIHALYLRVFSRRAEPAEVDAGLRFVMAAISDPSSREEEAPIWRYGIGRFDEAARRVEFQPLAHFKNGQWQAGPKLPDPKLGHVLLNASGGHAGPDSAHSPIRRWMAPSDGVVSIRGVLERPSEHGDGVLGRVISSRTGELLKVQVGPKQRIETKLDRVVVKAGETIDFIVDCLAGDNSDSFSWKPVIAGEIGTWDSAAQFAGPPPARPSPLKPWEQYAQVLLQANEFAFVD